MCAYKRNKIWFFLILSAIGVLLIFLIPSKKYFSEVSARSNPERVAFLERCGWEVEMIPAVSARLRIPLVFDEVYRRYNQLQRKQGFDLRRYAGKEAERYQYVVLNYPHYDGEVRANLLVLDGKIIGGDICSLEFAGFMHEILQNSGEKTAKLHFIRKKSNICVKLPELSIIFVCSQYSQIALKKFG